MIIPTSISPPSGTVLRHGRAPIPRGRGHDFPQPLPLSLVESELLLDVRCRSTENMLAEMNTVCKFNKYMDLKNHIEFDKINRLDKVASFLNHCNNAYYI